MNNLFKRCLCIVILLVLSLAFQCTASQPSHTEEKVRLAIVNPHVRYLQSFIGLVRQKVIDIPNLELNVIVYAKTNRNFEDLNEFIKKIEHPNIVLQKVEGDLDIKTLFDKNQCSESFYKIFKETDGVLFLGGDDLSPPAYNQKTRISTETTDLYRHYFELSFLFHVTGGNQNKDFIPYLEEKPGYVVLGFCLGMQTMNVAAGGTMHQDIPQDIYNLAYVEDVLNLDPHALHKSYWQHLYPLKDIPRVSFHKIKFVDEPFFAERLGIKSQMQPRVCSAHHQAVKQLGKGYETIATSLDGKVIEGIRHNKYQNVIGVQFHPEFYDLYNPQGPRYRFSPDNETTQNYYEILAADKSLQFHYNFWSFFNRMLSAPLAIPRQ